jgi:phosphosulfolactate phosphohydrolase-like enzyme
MQGTSFTTRREVDDVFQQSGRWPAEQRLLAGERGGVMVKGFDVGNSPLECTPDRVTGVLCVRIHASSTV